MNITVIDTLRFATRLKKSGFPPEQAEAVSRAINDELTDGVATKTHIDGAVTSLRGEISETATALRGEIGEAVATLRGEICRIETTMLGKFAQIDGKLAQIDGKFHAVDARFDAITTWNQKACWLSSGVSPARRGRQGFEYDHIPALLYDP